MLTRGILIDIKQNIINRFYVILEEKYVLSFAVFGSSAMMLFADSG